MAHHNEHTLEMSESIEMYLVRVAQLQQPEQPVPLSQLAHELSITAVSANEMCRKLVDRGLLEYEPYKGVTLTAAGDRLAQRVLRLRHLWQAFFVEKLGFAAAEADEIACRFEHVTPDVLADRLAAFLAAGEMPAFETRAACPLSTLTAGQSGRVVAIEADVLIRNFLHQQGLTPGETLRVLGVSAEGAWLVDVAGCPISLASAIAEAVQISLT